MRKRNTAPAMVLFVLLAILLLIVAMVGVAHAEEPPVRTARQETLHEAAEILRAAGYAEDSAVIRALQAEWMQEQEDLCIVAKVIQNEADPAWCEWEHCVAVGAVVCNRVASPWFPNTVREVVAAPGQYLASYTRDFVGTSRLAYLAAKAALDGDHDVPSDCYWQDNKVQGVSIWKSFICETPYKFRSITYICRGIVGVD